MEKQKDNIVRIGIKPIVSYLLAIQTIASEQKTDIIIQAKGKTMNRAIDIAQISKNKFNYQIKKIETGTEQIEITQENGEKRNINLSNINITIGR